MCLYIFDVLSSSLSVSSYHCIGKGGFTPLIVSAWEGHDTVVELLLRRGAHIDTRTNVRK